MFWRKLCKTRGAGAAESFLAAGGFHNGQLKRSDRSLRSGTFLRFAPLLVVAALLSAWTATEVRLKAQPRVDWKVSTTAFAPGGTIPKRFTCEGQDISPPLSWTSPPPGTQSLVLMILDPDAPSGTWTHWLIYNLPPTLRQLPENVPKHARLANGAAQGRNDFGRLGFGGPCPPPGKPHHYHFRLFALNTRLSLAPGATRPQVEQAIRGHIIAQAELVARFGR